MTKEIIEGIRKVIVPFVKKRLAEINYEGLGESDAKEFDEHMNEILDLATKALGQKSCSDVLDISVRKCEDAIGRADVEQTVEDNILCYTHSDRPIDQGPDTDCHMAIRTALRMLRKDLRKLPTVTSQQKVGHWIRKEDEFCWWYECDQCGEKPLHSRLNDKDVLSDWCPSCGAKMS